MPKWRYTITRIFGVALLLVCIGHGSTAQAFAAPSILNVEPVLLKGIVGVAKKKECKKCKKVKLLEQFSERRDAKDGRRSLCRNCTKEDGEKYRKVNKEKKAEYDRKYYIANRKQIKENTKKYSRINRKEILASRKRFRVANREKINKRNAQWKADNPDKMREFSRKYRQDNPEKGRAICRRRRAMKRAVLECFGVEEAKFVRSFWGNRCAVCGKTQKEEGKRAMPIDHWHPLSKGNPLTMANAVLLCISHNGKKRTKEPEEIFDAEIVSRIECQIEKQAMAWKEKC